MLHLLLSIAVAIKDGIEKIREVNTGGGEPPQTL
jgi:hypothetical protein